jgi:20S proteasome alpha/beta subunit
MTVVVGVRFDENVILAADREENDTYLRYSIQKIKRFKFPNSLLAGIAGDGDAHFIEYSTDKLKSYIASHPKLTIPKVGQTIEKILKSVFEEHIFASNLQASERRDFGLVAAFNHNGKSIVFKTQQAAPVEILDFTTSGYGSSYAEILLQRLWGTLTLHSAVLLCLHVVQQTKKHVCTVGGGTDIVILKSDGKSATLTPALTKPLEEMLEKLDYQFDGAFFSALYGGDWYRDHEGFRDKVATIRGEIENELNRLFAAFHLT